MTVSLIEQVFKNMSTQEGKKLTEKNTDTKKNVIQNIKCQSSSEKEAYVFKVLLQK